MNRTKSIAAILLVAVFGCQNSSQVADSDKSTPAPSTPAPTFAAEPSTRHSWPLEPEANKLRVTSILQDVVSIESECPAGQTWDDWQQSTGEYRAALEAKIPKRPQIGTGNAANMTAIRLATVKSLTDVPDVLEAKNFPLFEVYASSDLEYLYNPSSLVSFRENDPVVAAKRWLASQGIDLIFVPVPKMTEVYVERFLQKTPPDGIIAPHFRRTLSHLLRADVEVVNGFGLFRPQRDRPADSDCRYLYNTADTHWNPRAMRIMAKEIARRVQRYKFAVDAHDKPPISKLVRQSYHLFGTGTTQNGMWMLNEHQQEIANKFQPREEQYVAYPGGNSPDSALSPVMVIGNSYACVFSDFLSHELNLPIALKYGPGFTAKAFDDFLREPALLEHARVVVWITTGSEMAHFKLLPPQIMAATSHSP